MRSIGHLPTIEQAQKFLNHLLTNGVSAKIVEDKSHWEVWVYDEGQLELAREELQSYLDSPNSKKYKNVVVPMSLWKKFVLFGGLGLVLLVVIGIVFKEAELPSRAMQFLEVIKDEASKKINKIVDVIKDEGRVLEVIKDEARESVTSHTHQDAQCRDPESIVGVGYKGERNEGSEKHGKGKEKYADGKKFIGEWKDGELWDGVMCRPDGRIKGRYIAGLWHPSPEPCKHQDDYTIDGKGVKECEFYNGDRYVGEWRGNEYHGQGTYTWPSGQEYVGEWIYSRKWGQGTMTLSNGDKYSGQWEKDKKHGQGSQTYSDGKYIGEWQENKRHGQGTYTWASGRKYIGAWIDNEKHGQGTDTFPDGFKYEGAWEKDKKHGQGTYTYSDGSKFTGEIKKGWKWNGTTYNADETVKGTYSDGKWIPKVSD